MSSPSLSSLPALHGRTLDVYKSLRRLQSPRSLLAFPDQGATLLRRRVVRAPLEEVLFKVLTRKITGFTTREGEVFASFQSLVFLWSPVLPRSTRARALRPRGTPAARRPNLRPRHHSPAATVPLTQAQRRARGGARGGGWGVRGPLKYGGVGGANLPRRCCPVGGSSSNCLLVARSSSLKPRSTLGGSSGGGGGSSSRREPRRAVGGLHGERQTPGQRQRFLSGTRAPVTDARALPRV